MRSFRLPLALSLLSTFASACDTGPDDRGTSTGNPNTGGEENGGIGPGTALGGGNCEKVSSEELALDAASALGFSAQDVLKFVEGAHEETLTWYPQEIASYGPESGQVPMTLTVTRDGAPRLTKYKARSGGLEFGGNCTDAIEVDVEVALKTAQGALDEKLEGTLVLRSPLKASLALSPDPAKLGGSFQVTQVNLAGFKLKQLFLSMEFTSFGTSGKLQPTFEMRTEGSGVASAASGRTPLAAWGPPACDNGMTALPRSAKVKGFSADDAIAVLNAVHGASVSFNGAPASALTLAPFAAASEYACALLEESLFLGPAPLGTLKVLGALTVKSADGRIDGRWPVELTAKPSSAGALEQIEIGFDHSVQVGSGTPQQYGITGVDVSGYDSSYAQLMLSVTPQSSLSGELQVTGFKNAQCSTQVTMTPNGGASSPGCAGATPTQLVRALFVTTAP